MIPLAAHETAMVLDHTSDIQKRPKRGGVLALFFIALIQAACAERNFEINEHNREAVINDFTAGRIELTCQINCIWADAQSRERMAELYKLRRWEALVRLVIETGWDIDRNYYFLGRSAEELGAPEAAIAYFQRAMSRLPRGQCQTYQSANACVGIDVRRRSNERLAVLQRLTPASRRR